MLAVATIPSSVCALAQPSSPGRTLLTAELPPPRAHPARALSCSLACPPLARSLCGYLALPLPVLLARAGSTSTEHRNAHCRLASVSVSVSGIWHNFLAGRGRDKSVNKRHKTASRPDNAAQNRLSAPAARWNGHCLGEARVVGGRAAAGRVVLQGAGWEASLSAC